PVVLLGKKPAIHECLSKKPSSSERRAASSNTLNRYESEITIAIQAANRQLQKTDVMPVAETKEKKTTRTMSLLVSSFIGEFQVFALLHAFRNCDLNDCGLLITP